MRLGESDVEGNTNEYVETGRDMASRSSRPRGRLLCALAGDFPREGNTRQFLRGPAYLYLVLRSNDLDAFYCTPPEQRKDPSKPGGDASDERKRAILSRSGRARRKLACNDTRCPKPAARDETTPHRAPSRRRATPAIKSKSAQEKGDKFTQVAPDLPLRLARALRQRPLVGRARRRRQALGF